ncbi:hypothetical protein QAD02_019831 [Eretmocerus hayati]|uniref:Uncharacterized protein n=1 Tax=Eretmocerus hayati TaxID=131215 RepID=A0ACC2PKB7_9HYME|nr:hypothetical protein QAD02_019831 [Eretmocerus hayati]
MGGRLEPLGWRPSEKLLMAGERGLAELFDCNSSGDELSLGGGGGLVLERGGAFSRLLAVKSVTWARDSLQRLPIRLTLENVGLFAVVLALIMPRALTYLLLYPIFRLVFGTLYPAYASYKAVRTKNVKEYVKWMMYWIVFALFTCAETFTDVFFSFWFPFYYEIKIILVLWLLSPATKGSSILYRRFVHPALCRREAEIDDAIARATEQGYTAFLQLGSKGVNYATTMLMQTAIKGGGGLVQQLRKSYSLSDLTGEKEDENCNNKSLDETDYNEPRLRDRTGRKNYSPRRTQSSGNQMDMFFSEVDDQMRQSRSREAIESLTNMKSSEDISSGYSSGEALQIQKNSTNREHLVRTASLGARNRIKPRSSIKKAPEVKNIEEEGVESIEPFSAVNPLSLFYSEKALEMLTYLSGHNRNYMKMLQHRQDLSDSDDDSSTLTADPSVPKTKSAYPRKMIDSNRDIEEEEQEIRGQGHNNSRSLLCEQSESENVEVSANGAFKQIVFSEKETDPLHLPGDKLDLPVLHNIASLSTTEDSPSISPSNSLTDCSERAGRYHKKPAPKVPESSKGEDDLDEQAVKATLVIKAGTLKTFTNNEAVDAVIRRRKKLNARTAAKDSFTKILTIPKNIFHNTFKDKDDDVEPTTSERSPVQLTSHKDINDDTRISKIPSNAGDEKIVDLNEAGESERRNYESNALDFVNREDSKDNTNAKISRLQTQGEETVV